jgi:hypothetical protein
MLAVAPNDPIAAPDELPPPVVSGSHHPGVPCHRVPRIIRSERPVEENFAGIVLVIYRKRVEANVGGHFAVLVVN